MFSMEIYLNVLDKTTYDTQVVDINQYPDQQWNRGGFRMFIINNHFYARVINTRNHHLNHDAFHNIVENEWVHVVFTHVVGGSWKAYVNGVLVNSTTSTVQGTDRLWDLEYKVRPNFLLGARQDSSVDKHSNIHIGHFRYWDSHELQQPRLVHFILRENHS